MAGNITKDAQRIADKYAEQPAGRTKKVISGDVTTKKKSVNEKILDAFVEEDMSTVKSYVVKDVLVPNIKNSIADMVKGTVDIILFGSRKNGSSNSNKKYVERVSYNNYSEVTPVSRQQVHVEERFDYQNIILQNREDAEAVMDELTECFAEYGVITIGDLYAAVGITPPYTYQKYGWRSLERFRVKHVRDGWLIDAPRAYPID